MISIKSKFNNDVRRFCVEKDTNLAELKRLLQQIYQQVPENCFLEVRNFEFSLISCACSLLLKYSVKGGNSVSLAQLNSDQDLQNAMNSSSSLIYINVKPTPTNQSQTTGIKRGSSSNFDVLSEFSNLLQSFVKMSLSTSKKVDEKKQETEEDLSEQLCDQLSNLVLDEMPSKKEVLRKYNLAQGNSNEPCSDSERRAAFKKLVGAPSPYVQVTASGIGKNFLVLVSIC